MAHTVTTGAMEAETGSDNMTTFAKRIAAVVATASLALIITSVGAPAQAADTSWGYIKSKTPSVTQQ